MENSIKTCKEMLTQRGYNNFTKLENDDDIYQILTQKSDNDKILIFFLDKIKFDIKCMNNIIVILNDLSIKHSIIVYRKNITAQTKKTINHCDDLDIELFNEEDLQFNITKHCLQPQFKLLTDVEAENFKTKFGIKIPIIRLDDPISCFYHYRKGNIIKIIRKNGYITYRIVSGNTK